MRLPLFFALLLALCLANSSHAQTAPEINVTANVSYRDYPRAPDEKNACQLDVYAPANAKNLPVLVWFHGGDKATRLTTALCKTLAGEGFVIASANYRLNPAVKYPTYLEDGAAAVAWMRQNAAKFGGDGAKLFIGGHSAGGFLVALLGTDARYLAAHDLKLSELRGVIALSGEMTTHFQILAERGLPAGSLMVDEAAPLFHAAKKPETPAPAFLILWGENDMALRAEQNQLFAATLKNAGHSNVKTEQIAGRDHGGTMSHVAQADDPVRREIVDFIRAQKPRNDTD